MMVLKADSEISTAISQAHGVTGFKAAAAFNASAAVAQVKLLMAPVATLYSALSAIPWHVLFLLAQQLLPIIFPDGGQSIEKLQAILQLIASIFA